MAAVHLADPVHRGVGPQRFEEGFNAGKLRPLVAEAFPFDRAGDAHRFIAERRNVGKVVLVPGA
jgi:NADPH:quinone reductase-like Zn-dependent oxidoreductase